VKKDGCWNLNGTLCRKMLKAIPRAFVVNERTAFHALERGWFRRSWRSYAAL
jgi:hypothetical protein